MTIPKALTRAHVQVMALADKPALDDGDMDLLRAACREFHAYDPAARPKDENATDAAPVARQKPARTVLPRPKPKPAELVASERIVRERSGGDCEARTPACEGRATQAHHVAGRSNHAPDALLDVCGQGNLTGCHGYIHQHPDESYAAGWMRKRNGETPRPEYQWARP